MMAHRALIARGALALILVLAFGMSAAPARGHTDPEPLIVWTDAGTGKVQQTNPSSATPISVDFATSDEEAVGGQDYPANQEGRLYWQPGETWPKQFYVLIYNDTVAEPEEDFRVTLSNPVGGTVGEPSMQRVRIRDDDGGPFTPPESVHPDTPGTFRFSSDVSVVDEDAGVQILTVLPAANPAEDLVTEVLSEPTSLLVDAGADVMYVTDPGTGTVYWVDAAGTMNPTPLITGLGSPTDLAGATDPDPLMPSFWLTDAEAGKVFRADISYNSPPSLDALVELLGPGSGLIGPTGIAVDADGDRMWITDPGAGVIWQCALDGSGLFALAGGLDNPGGIAFVIPEPTTLLLFAAGVLLLRKRR